MIEAKNKLILKVTYVSKREVIIEFCTSRKLPLSNDDVTDIMNPIFKSSAISCNEVGTGDLLYVHLCNVEDIRFLRVEPV